MKKKEEKVYAKGFKGFGPGMICRGKHYKENAVFEEKTAEMCERGMHFCENPLDVLDYYPLLNAEGAPNEFAEVESLAPVETKKGKSVTTKLRVGKKRSLGEFITAAINFLLEKAKRKIAGDCSKLASSGNCSQLASSGYNSQLASSGNCSQLASSGYNSQLASSGYNSQLASSGDCSKLASSGNYSQLAVTGNTSIAASIGVDGRVKGVVGSFLVCVEWATDTEPREPLCVKGVKVDGRRIKANTWYTVKNGKWKEITE